MRCLVILFLSHLAVTTLGEKSKTNQLLEDFESRFESLPKRVGDLLMPDMQLDNLSEESSVTLAETMKLLQSTLMDMLRGQASAIGDGVIDNVRKANYELQQAIKSTSPFNDESISFDDDLQELTDQLEVVLQFELIPDAGEIDSRILDDDVVEVCRTVIDDVYEKQHSVRRNVKPTTWRSFEDISDRISAVRRSWNAPGYAANRRSM